MHWATHLGSKEIIVKFRDLLILAGGAAAVAQASALSLGNTQDPVQLGAPVNLVFPVQTDSGLTPANSCINAEVWMGDFALSSSQVTLIPLKNSVRVRTAAPVSEPLVTVKLQAGCTGEVTRSYTFFADPPSSMAASVEPIDLSKIHVSTIPVATAAAVASEPTTPKKPRPAKRSTTPATKAVKAAASAAPVATISANASNTANPVEAPPAAAPQTASEGSVTAAANDLPQSRLRVEPIEGFDINSIEAPASSSPPEITNSPQTVPSATIDTSTQLILDANAARMESMEKQLQALQTQLLSNRTEITSLQSQLTLAQNQELPIWVNIVLVLLALAIATIAWLLQRIKQERLRAQRTWADTVLAADNSTEATTIDTRTPVASKEAMQAEPVPPLPPAAPAHGLHANATESSAQPAWNSSETQTPTLMPVELFAEFEEISKSKQADDTIGEVLTAQALFDVQEQAEFYASIGENDQAIEILQTHIAQHTTSSPLAYIELLQLLYRLSRTETFEQVRQQFQEHFNVKVPEFLSFSRKGQDLWTGYPDVLEKVEAAWPTDEVQTLLRNLIVCQSQGAHADSDVRFDLSAFDDLLMLYNVAQTTPASSRGKLPGRVRAAPIEVPLPEFLLEQNSPSADASSSNSPKGESSSPATASLPLHAASLDLLNTVSTPAPLAQDLPLGDSPFQGPSHLAPNSALVDGLSLDWVSTSTPASAEPQPTAATEASTEVLDLLSTELAAFSMDERDLPPSNPR